MTWLKFPRRWLRPSLFAGRFPLMRLTPVLALALALAACAPVRQRPADAALEVAQRARESALAAQTDWRLSGRIALSAAGRGGSGRIEWRQQGEDFDIRLTAPVTGQSWRLQRTAGRATLEGLADGPRTSMDAEHLLEEATGWRIPVDALSAWVRGARAAGPAELSFDPAGRPATLVQSQWTVEYRAWDGGSPPRPLKLFARQGDASVRLVIDGWDGP